MARKRKSETVYDFLKRGFLETEKPYCNVTNMEDGSAKVDNDYISLWLTELIDASFDVIILNYAMHIKLGHLCDPNDNPTVADILQYKHSVSGMALHAFFVDYLRTFLNTPINELVEKGEGPLCALHPQALIDVWNKYVEEE